MDEKVQDTVQLILSDPERNCSYILHVSEEDAARAQTDIYYFQSLFDYARHEDENRQPANSSRSTECSQFNGPLINDEVNNLHTANNTHTTENTDAPTNYIWQYNDTLLLIRSYQNHQEELDHPRKSNFFWDNVANDLVSHKYPVNGEMCRKKFYNLKRSYSDCKDNNKTGRGSSRFLFYNEMDEILGDRPCNSGKCVVGSLKKKTTKKDEETANENDMNIVNKMKKKRSKKRKNSKSDDSEDENWKKQKLELLKEKMRLEASRIDLQREMLQFWKERSKEKKSKFNAKENPNTDDLDEDEDENKNTK